MNRLSQALITLFDNKLVHDDRVSYPLLDNILGYRVGIKPIELQFHIQIVILIVLQIAVMFLLAVLTWYGIVLPGKKQCQQSIQSTAATPPRPSLASVCLGLGVVLPVSLVGPLYAMDAIDLRSKTLRFGCILVPTLVPLKCMDALFGVDSDDRRRRMQSLTHYVYYMALPLLPKYAVKDDDREDYGEASAVVSRKFSRRRVVLPVSMISFWKTHVNFLLWFTISYVACNVLEPFGHRPFSEQALGHGKSKANELYPIFDLARMYNNYLQAVSLFLTLIFSLYGVAMVASIVGRLQVQESIFDKQPMFYSTSPSDFWGNRWNSLIHHLLKEGIYKPLRAGMGWDKPIGRSLALVFTFVASGLIHEHVWVLLFFKTTAELAEGDRCATCYPYVFGKHLIFFLWNGALLVLEDSVVGKAVSKFAAQTSRRIVPAFVLSHMVVLLALPVAHLFTEDLLDSGYFSQLQLAMPMLTFDRL